MEWVQAEPFQENLSLRVGEHRPLELTPFVDLRRTALVVCGERNGEIAEMGRRRIKDNARLGKSGPDVWELNEKFVRWGRNGAGGLRIRARHRQSQGMGIESVVVMWHLAKSMGILVE
jgi:hypothetical protein